MYTPKVGSIWRWKDDKAGYTLEITSIGQDGKIYYKYCNGFLGGTVFERNSASYFLSIADHISDPEHSYSNVLSGRPITKEDLEALQKELMVPRYRTVEEQEAITNPKCKPGCTPSSPCLVVAACPAIEEQAVYKAMLQLQDVAKQAPKKEHRPVCGPPEPMRTGIGGLACDWMVRK